ncbi:phosphodiesterase [Rheinheimera mesophila]|uniref:Phosphodiesterase n=1 Tax=Rheinheimera mesophila TaxID=1547515 RepID=A0A3P3QRR5_9GAMM|nr:diguanylate cyclase [Rheinheimera mesophila]RRJ23725.1 phosphodiesterase [Rheinheimera mesophila]
MLSSPRSWLSVVVLTSSAPAWAQSVASQPLFYWVVLLTLLVLLLALWIVLLKKQLKAQKAQRVGEKAATANDLAFLSLHDDTSGLPNKLQLQQQFELWCRSHPNHKASLLLLKIENFEQVNQALGHQNANLVLVQIAQRINTAVQSDQELLVLEQQDQQYSKVAHIGGVDFVLWVDASVRQHAAEQIARRLEHAVPEALLIHGCAVEYQLKSGIAHYPQHGELLSDLIERAHLAIQNRHWAHSNSTVFHPELISYNNDKLGLMAELRHAISQQQLKLHIQPQIALSSRQVIAGEVLVRWHHPRRGLLGPTEFLELAEQMGVIYPLTQWVLEKAVMMLAELAQQQIHCKIAVNISSKDLLQDELVDSLELLLKRYKVQPSQLVLELKESALVAEPDKAMRMLKHLAQLGVELALDDFGTGFSSLAYLRELPISQVKVDCSFIFDLHRSDTHTAITGAIIDMAKNMNFMVVAEGVEQPEVEQKLIAMGCTRGQGFLYAKPFALDAFPDWVKQWSYSKATY